MSSGSRTRITLIIAGACVGALAVGLVAGYGAGASRADAQETTLASKIKKSSEAEAALKSEVKDLQAESVDLRERYEAASDQVGDLEAQIASLTGRSRGESSDPDGLALAAMGAIGEPDVVTRAEFAGGVVRIYTNITDPRGADGSSEAQHAIRICELAASAVGDVGIAVYESDDSTFVTGTPCIEH